MDNSLTSTWLSGGEFPPDLPDLEPVCLIGEGAYGKVWLARNRTTGLLRAVKLIPWDRAGREVESITRLESKACREHPNLLRIHHVGRASRYVYCIMDPADDVSGAPPSTEPGYRPATLREKLKAGPLAPVEASQCAEQLLAGLAHLHDAGMVHRDVKPANCLFVEGNLKLADFGLLTEADLLTSRAGTLKYMPPDRHMNERADVYAAGLVIYEMITGLPVDMFPSLDHCLEEVARDPTLKALNRISLRACDPDPGGRFANAHEMLAALHRSLRPERPKRTAWLSIAGCVVMALVAAVWWSGRRNVSVNFLTVPPESNILVDGQTLRQPDGAPYTTPCTVKGLPLGKHRVVFRDSNGREVDAGIVDFGRTREIFVPGQLPLEEGAPRSD